jgi:monoterpene epsilon-lactone hydrolase
MELNRNIPSTNVQSGIFPSIFRSVVIMVGVLFWTNLAIASETTIPTTISQQAQDYIANNEAIAVDPKSLDEWREISGATVAPGVLLEDGERILKLWPVDLELIEIGGIQHLLATPDTYDREKDKRIVIYAHGGAYVAGRPEDQMGSIAVLAKEMNVQVLGLRYPLAWQKPFPAARDLLVEVYQEVLKSHSPRHIALSGDSAGGGLVLSSVLKMRDDGLPMPAALGLLSPWADVSKTGDSMTVAAGHDPLINYDVNLEASAKLYANGLDLKDPGVSPLYGDYAQGFPPTFMSSGTRDLFLSHVARMQRKLTDAGVDNEVHVYEGMWHVFQIAPDPAMPEALSAWRDLISFVERHMAR